MAVIQRISSHDVETVRLGDHIIVQEASKLENGDVFITFTNCETSMHMSGDDA